MRVSPSRALGALAAQLRDEGSVISPHVHDSPEPPALGVLAAAGPRATGAPGEYALLVEAIREGYLLHYDRPRVVLGADDDLRLLAGDYLYARGLERLAALGDLPAVRELADLISLCAAIHAEPGGDRAAAGALWLASVVAVAGGAAAEHQGAKGALRKGEADAALALWRAARATAAREGFGDALEAATEAVDLASLEIRGLG